MRTTSEGPSAGENRRHRAGQDLQVEAERPVLDVVDVEHDPFVEAELAATADLPQAGDAGYDLEAAPLPLFVALDLVGDRWTWPNQAHLTPQHVPELRNLVQAGAAN